MENNKVTVKTERDGIIQKLGRELGRLNTSAVMNATAIANRIGMGDNDWKVAEMLVRNGAMPAGKLAQLSGLTTGAITGVVDRLEKAGWARRVADPNDRRKVIIEPGLENTKTRPYGHLLNL